MQKTFCFLFLASIVFISCKNSSEKKTDDKKPSIVDANFILKTPTGNIEGSLLVPVSDQPVSCVLIIPGSGPTDRNGNNKMGLSTDTYKMIADSLYAHGIASLRFDKRGIGKSASAMKSENEILFETYIDDAKKLIDSLKHDSRFSAVIVAGHSEGSLIGMVACETDNANGFISLSGAGESIDKIIYWQIKNSRDSVLAPMAKSIFTKLKQGKLEPNVPKELASIFRLSVQPYMISWMKFNPAEEIKKVKIPILIIQGTTDIQVTVNEAKNLSEAKPDATLLMIDNMNHTLKSCSSFNQNDQNPTYTNPKLVLHPKLIPAIENFISSLK